MFKSTGCTTGRFLMISAQGGRIGGAGHLRRPGNGPSRRLSMSELISSKLSGMVAEEWNQKNPFLAIKVQVQSSSHVHHMFTLHSNYIRSTNVNYMLNQHIVSHHIVKLISTAYNMLTLVTCEGLVSWPWHDLL